MRLFSLAVFIIFTTFCVIVAVSNRITVFFSLYPLPFGWDVPIYILLFAGIFIGLGAGSIVIMIKSVKQSRKIRRKDKEIRELTELVHKLEASPEEQTTSDS